MVLPSDIFMTLLCSAVCEIRGVNINSSRIASSSFMFIWVVKIPSYANKDYNK